MKHFSATIKENGMDADLKIPDERKEKEDEP